MAAIVTPRSTSQSRITISDRDIVENVRTSPTRRPRGPGVRTQTVTDALPTSSPATRSNKTSTCDPSSGRHRGVVRRDLCQDTDPRARSNNHRHPRTPRHTPQRAHPRQCVSTSPDDPTILISTGGDQDRKRLHPVQPQSGPRQRELSRASVVESLERHGGPSPVARLDTDG